MTDYLTSCPRCGQELSIHVGDPQSAPWLCTMCRLGFWSAELAPDARIHFRPHHQDFGHGRHLLDIRLKVAGEQRNAELRGTSVREDQLHQLPVHELGMLMKKKIDPALGKQVQEIHQAKTLREGK